MPSLSPLRYPGGKGSLQPVIEAILYANKIQGGAYAEPFAGGSAVAIGLLLGEHVDEILINDFDPRIYAFWKSILGQNSRFMDLIENTPVTVEEWERQRSIYLKPHGKSLIKIGFSAFYLNRCNRSGIMVNGGPIGGKDQSGKWKIDARFNRETLSARIKKIHEKREQIRISGRDCLQLLNEIETKYAGKRILVYLDPPYFKQGPRLYFSSFDVAAHAALAERMKSFKLPWIMTYDDVPEISVLYKWAKTKSFGLRYSAYEQRSGGELLIWPNSVKIPNVSNYLRTAP